MCCNDSEVKEEKETKPNIEEAKAKVLEAINSFINGQTSTYNKNGVFNPNLTIPVIKGFKGKSISKKYYVIISYVSDSIRYIGVIYLIKNNNINTVNSQVLSCSSSTGLPMMDNVVQVSKMNFNSIYKKL